MVSTRRTSQPEVDEAAGGSSRTGRRLSEIQKPTASARRTRASQDAGKDSSAGAAKKGTEPEVPTDEDSAPDSNDDSADAGEVEEQQAVSKAAAAAAPAAKSGKGKTKAVAPSKSKPAATAAAADASLLQAAAKAAAAVKSATKAPAQHAKRGAAAASKAAAPAATAAPAEEKADEPEHKEEEEEEEVAPPAAVAPLTATAAPVQRQGPSEPPADVVATPAATAATGAAAPPAAAPAAAAAAAKFHYEFMGPWGPVFIMLVLPLVVLGLAQACTHDFCIDRAYISSTLENFDKQQLSRERVVPLLHSAKVVLGAFFSSVLTLPAAGTFFGWMALQVVLERFLPAEIITGVALADGSKLKYRINGHLVFWVTLLLVGYGFPTQQTVTTTGYSSVGDSSEQGDEQQQQLVHTVWQLGRFPLELLYDRFTELAAVACLLSAVLSGALYAASQRSKQVALAAPGTSGFVPYDLFMGRELNPRFSSSSSSTFDLKFFCELRPGLLGWTVLNLGMLCKQAAVHGAVSPSMLIVVLAQGMYVWDALYNERSVLTTMDITSDGFGFMLAFGDLAWVPFTYSLQAKYLVDHAQQQLPLWHYALVVALHCVGYALFRGANSEKDQFRRDPAAPGVSHLKFIQTQRGTKLLTSGYWGLARKVSSTAILYKCILCVFSCM
jgi:Delta14-sterol reductase